MSEENDTKWVFGDGETIIQIHETTFEGRDGYGNYEGYIVTTNRRRIKLGISTGQSCCEVTGYFSSIENPLEFIGGRLMSVEVVDTLLNKERIDEVSYLDQGDVMFVNFNTDIDTLQFTVYNSHNGYYGHEAVVEVEKVEVEEHNHYQTCL